MVKRISDCVNCGFPCRHEACSHYEVTVLICDKCGKEVEELYEYGSKEYCADCVLSEFTMVEV